MREPFIAGNWKMNKTVSEAINLAKEVVEQSKGVKHRVMIAPNFTCLVPVAEIVKGSNVELGAQNMAAEESGAHTGETSADMLLDAGVKIVILGHSERRHVYGETNELINKKVKLALAKGLEVILAVGELLEEREAGKAEAVCFDQIEKGLAGVTADQLKKVTIAYEPVWAIGTGKTATPQDADDMHKAIRSKLADLYSADAANAMIIQYGGSVKPNNVKDLMSMENIDGGLIGGASLTAENFIPIVKFNE